MYDQHQQANFCAAKSLNSATIPASMKTALLPLLIALSVFAVSPAFAGNKKDSGHSCCATTASNTTLCVDYASLKLNADQKAKIVAWQDECSKAGCTDKSRSKFLKQAKGILSADQYAKLEKQCKAKTAGKSA